MCKQAPTSGPTSSERNPLAERPRALRPASSSGIMSRWEEPSREVGILDRRPISRQRLRRDLLTLGVQPGMTLTVHSSLSAIGWVIGGAPTVVRALIDSVGEEGTLVMPAATPMDCDPATWTSAKVPPNWLDETRENLPLFDRQTTPTTLGAIPETFRCWPGTQRSEHPVESVCARGPSAAAITAEHPLEFSEGPGTPFAKLHDLESWILLLGVGFNRCTALHFAESMADQRRTTSVRFPASRDARRVWIEVPNVADDNDTHFPIIGEKYLLAGRARQTRVGEAMATLFPMRDLVDFATKYFASFL